MPTPNPLPTMRNGQALPVSSMDSIRCGSLDGKKPNLDEQRFEQLLLKKNNISIATDSKLLWTAPLIPYRTIVVTGANRASGGDGGPFLFSDLMTRMMGDPAFWTRNEVGAFGSDPSTYTIPQWGRNYLWNTPALPTVNLADIGPDRLGNNQIDLDLSWLSSGWNWTLQGGTVLPDNPVDPDLIFKIGFLTQIICPNAFRALNYELWTVSARNAVIPYGGPLGDVPGPPGPWSDSSDWNKTGGGVIHPGQTLMIPCPINSSPSSPPAPSSFNSPNGYSAWEGWGVDQFIIFTGPSS